MADPDSDEDSTFVTIGTPLETFDEDEVLKKPLAVHEQTVKDQQGRQRFHGAFTGGFSAGFYNTVGTLEGWTPSTFISSRSKKADVQGQRPEDFMDDEDFVEHGIAPRQISTTENYKSTKKRQLQSTSSGSIIPGDLAALRDLILPARLTIGIKLLRDLGWKEGQGIGPRVKRKVKRKVKPPTGQKIYGCALPREQEKEDSMSSSEDEYAEGLTFAPKDSNPISFVPKSNTHGIGYSGINPSKVFSVASAVSLFEQPVVTKSGRKGISGTAFGVGALEEDDDDIYSRDNMSNYDRVLGGEDEDNLHGWTAPSQRRGKKSRFGPPVQGSYVEKVLEGFSAASSSLKPNKVYPPPVVPRDYRPVHHFKMFDLMQSQPQTQGSQSSSKLDASARAVMLGEVGTVFDLVSKSDKEKMKAAKEAPVVKAGTYEPGPEREKVQIHFAPQKAGLQKPPAQKNESSSDQPSGTSQESTPSDSKQPLFKGGLAGFKPFSKDPAKQERYEKFVELQKQGRKDEFAAFQVNMTEWEKTREREEFERAALIYKPMSLLMASRFHHAQYDDDKTDGVKLEAPKKVLTDGEQAASCKMYGKLTRESYEWHPDRILCKRFNIPNPYPSSTIVGLPGTKRNKFTVFDFLTIPAGAEPPPPPPDVTLASVAATKQQKTKKPGPLAILNTPSPAQQVVRPSTSAPSVEEPMDVQDVQPMEFSDSGAEIPPEDAEKRPATGGRPPMDLFKAIFADSSDESSSEEEKVPKEIPDNRDTEVESDEEHLKQKKQISTDSSSAAGTPPGSPPPMPRSSEIYTEPSKPKIAKSLSQPALEQTANRKDGGIFAMINKQIEQERAGVDQNEAVNSGSPKLIKDTHDKTLSQPPSEDGDSYGSRPPERDSGTMPPGGENDDIYGPLPPSSLGLQSHSSQGNKLSKIAETERSQASSSYHSPTHEKDRSSSHKKHKHKHKHKKKDSKDVKHKDLERDPKRHNDSGELHRRDEYKGESTSRRGRDNEGRKHRERGRSAERDRSRDVLKERDRVKDKDRDRSSEDDRIKERKMHKDKAKSKDDHRREKSPVWVEAKTEKSKHKKKKSKHKKHKSKKSKKKKKSRPAESDSGESADSESDSDDSSEEVPTNSHLLQRIMMLKKPQAP